MELNVIRAMEAADTVRRVLVVFNGTDRAGSLSQGLMFLPPLRPPTPSI
jgi:hypothetical protein